VELPDGRQINIFIRKKKIIFLGMYWMETTAMNTDAFSIHRLLLLFYILITSKKEGRKKNGYWGTMGIQMLKSDYINAWEKE
jgi:hypothetical protein